MNLLEVNKLCKTYGSGETAVKALKSVTFSVPKGEYVAIVGESGSGKSTLLNMIGALDMPTSGSVVIDGKNIFSLNDRKLTVFRRRNIGFIFQAFNLVTELTVEQNIMFPMLLDYQKPDKKYLEELLAVLDLKERRHHLSSQLSGGQQQRVAIGRALFTRPSLILADEPTGNLDTHNSSEVIALLKEASKKYEQTIIMITHNLSLVPISAKVRRRQSRMTILCIIISVLLVTAVFSVADMFLRAENAALREKHGNWHIKMENISRDLAEEINQRPDVEAIGWSEVFNSDAAQPYYIGEKKAALYGADSVYMTQLTDIPKEGVIPQNENEVMLSANAKLALEVQVGDSVTLQTPAGNAEFIVSGFGSEDQKYYQGQTYLVAVYLNRTAFTSIMEQNSIPSNPTCYIRFQNASNASKAITEIRRQYDLPENSISENTAIMGLAGKSSSQSMQNIYGLAAILFLLVLLAGVLMISGSMNSNVAQRTKFFGMMRCIGASRRQIIRFVRLEALNWCKTAVPAGSIFGTAISWGICALLHFGIGGEFAAMPVFALSPVGLICGGAVGIVTVLLAAQSPAKRAARVSPMAAVSGNGSEEYSIRQRLKRNLGKIEWTLGIHHATASKKNWFLMTSSFALSIILFLCFSVGLDFAYELLPTLRPWQPDVTLGGYVNELVLDQSLGETIRSIPGVDDVWGSSYIKSVPAASSQSGVDHVNLVSYNDGLLDCAKDSVVQGDLSAIYGNSKQVMTVLGKDNPLKVGETIHIAGEDLQITCAVSEGLYPSEYSILCSQETFERLTGKKNYNLIGIRLSKDAGDETIKEINGLADKNTIFTDMRERKQEDKSTYLASRFLVYSFLTIVALISLFNIINSISMSVTARTKQYGAMRAVGMDRKQIMRMISAEAFTYAISGLTAGCGIGLPLSRFLHIKLITQYFGAAWNLPVALIGIVIVLVVGSAILAVRRPVKRLCNMEITAAINEL